MKKLLGGVAAAVTLACYPRCVARGSLISTPRGPRRIEELDQGDEVFCADPETGALVAATVAATRRAERECIRLAFDGGELAVTSDHPLYCPITREWAPAGDWALGRRAVLLCVDRERMETASVVERSTFAGVHEVFDLTVDHPLHNFVANGVLVHNKEPLGQVCGQVDGGTVREWDSCTSADGGQGTIRCGVAAGEFICDVPGEEFPDPDAGADAGNSDDGGTDGGEPDAGP